MTLEEPDQEDAAPPREEHGSPSPGKTATKGPPKSDDLTPENIRDFIAGLRRARKIDSDAFRDLQEFLSDHPEVWRDLLREETEGHILEILVGAHHHHSLLHAGQFKQLAAKLHQHQRIVVYIGDDGALNMHRSRHLRPRRSTISLNRQRLPTD